MFEVNSLGRSQVVRQWVLVPPSLGSNPSACVMRGNDNLARLRQFLNTNASSFTDYAAVDTQSSAKINNVERGNYFL